MGFAQDGAWLRTVFGIMELFSADENFNIGLHVTVLEGCCETVTESHNPKAK